MVFVCSEEYFTGTSYGKENKDEKNISNKTFSFIQLH